MAFAIIISLTTIHVHDIKSLRAMWKHYGRDPLVGGFTIDKPLTPAQHSRLSVRLRDCLKVVPR
jgi:hypothetical protein